MPDVNIAELRLWQREVAAQAGERDRIAASIVSRAAELSAIETQIADAEFRGVASTVLQKKHARITDAHAADVESMGRVTDELRDVLNRMRLDPGDADPAYPLMLMPVRLETRYTADGSALAIVTTRLATSSAPKLVEQVRCVTTPGTTIDVLVTEAGLAVNPRRVDLSERLRHFGLKVLPIEALQAAAARLSRPAVPRAAEGRVIAVVEYRDGTVIDLIRAAA